MLITATEKNICISLSWMFYSVLIVKIYTDIIYQLPISKQSHSITSEHFLIPQTIDKYQLIITK